MLNVVCICKYLRPHSHSQSKIAYKCTHFQIGIVHDKGRAHLLGYCVMHDSLVLGTKAVRPGQEADSDQHHELSNEGAMPDV